MIAKLIIRSHGVAEIFIMKSKSKNIKYSRYYMSICKKNS